MGDGRGKGYGTGSPISFLCAVERREPRSWGRDPARHIVELTGRTRPYKPKRLQARGARTSKLAREYRCSCGHVGWSAHVDLERRDPEGR